MANHNHMAEQPSATTKNTTETLQNRHPAAKYKRKSQQNSRRGTSSPNGI